MAGDGVIRMRLVRDTDMPPSGDGSAFVFGLQDKDGRIVEASRDGDGGFRFDFELEAKAGPDPQRPVFTGRFASGPRDERFVYLSWRRRDCETYINRIKARLKDIDWALVRAAQTDGKRLMADMSGRKPGGGTVPVAWRLVDD